MPTPQVITGLRGGDFKGREVLQSPSSHLLDADHFTPSPALVLDAKEGRGVCTYLALKRTR